MNVRVLFFLCKPCMVHHKATGMVPMPHFECKCIYLPYNPSK